GTVTYLADNDGRLATSEGWHVSSAYGQGLQRYYVTAAKHGCVTGYSAAGWAHYTTSAGYVLRGHLTSGTVTYLADNDGRLATSEGWHVSSAYGQGLQRYYVTAAKHGCVTGYSAAGWAHYTTPAGYVARGAYDTGAGRVYVANNDGRLAWGTRTGWVVQNYGSGLQRYYVSASDHGACSGFFSVAGYGRCFGVGGAGYVMRGKMGWGSTVLLADNEGKLATQSGWLVTGAYDGGTPQRYYMVNAWSDYKGARTGWFTVSGSNFYGTGSGYVLRNSRFIRDGYVTVADNDGKVARATLSGNDDLDRKLANIIANSTGFSLWNCYSYVRDSFSYTVENEYPGGSWQSWSIPYAIEMINNRSGNCYRWASVMCWLARACGYDAHAVSGQVLGSSGWAAHGWTEINEGGSSYLYDPEMAHFHPGYSFYRTTLDGAPLYYRHI
ncbi:MAG: hypothetical protein LKF44_07460, partial [Atopobiaceae bacterium]|nr:hypothetical protein [Atopobiaceae bacterium]